MKKVILATTVAAFLLVPVASASAEGLTVNIVNVAGTGKGTVKTFTPVDQTEPPINCSGPPKEGVCVQATGPLDGEAYTVVAIPVEGFVFTGWTIQAGSSFEPEPGQTTCDGGELEALYVEVFNEPGPYEGLEGFCQVAAGGEAKVTATFALGTLPTPESLTVNVTGNLKGTVKTFTLTDETEPPIDCSGPPKAGTCTQASAPANGVAYYLAAIPAKGSKFVDWTIQVGSAGEETSCDGNLNEQIRPQWFEEPFPGYEGMEGLCAIEPEGGYAELTATFIHGDPCGDCRTLTVTKSPDPSTGKGAGSVQSKPRGIKCGPVCTEAVSHTYRETPIVLTEKPATGSTFVKWVGGPCNGKTETTCTMPMSEYGEEVGAVFSGTSQPIVNPQELTAYKTGGGKGAVQVYGGLTCDAECIETTSLFPGPDSEKGKPGKTVLLKQAPAFGSAFVGWSGCESEPEGNCQVAMESAKSVTAEYEALPNVNLTVEKSAYAGGAGTAFSMPKGIKCGAYCTAATAAMPEGADIALKAKPAKENVFVEWEGGDCDESKALVCAVTTDHAETIKAVFAGTVKTIKPVETLTLSKAGSGFGTVKASGLGCEFLCTSTDVIYQGPIIGEKPKPGKLVTLKAISAPGSKTVKWSGCDSEPEGNCVVTMGTNREVTAIFDELE